MSNGNFSMRIIMDLVRFACSLVLCTRTSASFTEKILSKGTLNSKNFPLDYTNKLHQHWPISFPDIVVVHLDFRAFILEESVHCKADYVAIYKGILELEHNRFGERLCGRLHSNFQMNMTEPVYDILIVFHSDESAVMKGFLMEYTAVSPEVDVICGMMHQDHGPSQEVSSLLVGNQEGRPPRYPRVIDCAWNLETNFSYELSLEVNLLLDMTGENCTHNYVAIVTPCQNNTTSWEVMFRNNDTDVWSSQYMNTKTDLQDVVALGRFCGNIARRLVYKTKADVIKVMFHSDFAVANGYFRLILRPTKPRTKMNVAWIQHVSVPHISSAFASLAFPIPQSLPDQGMHYDSVTWLVRTFPGYIIQYDISVIDYTWVVVFDSPTTDSHRQLDKDKGYSSGYYLTILSNRCSTVCPRVMYRSVNIFTDSTHPFNVGYSRFSAVLFEHYYSSTICCTYHHYRTWDNIHITHVSKITVKTNADHCRYFGVIIYDGSISDENRHGPFCEMFSGNIEFVLNNFVSYTGNVFVIVYMYHDPRSAVFSQDVVLSFLLGPLECRTLNSDAIDQRILEYRDKISFGTTEIDNTITIDQDDDCFTFYIGLQSNSTQFPLVRLARSYYERSWSLLCASKTGSIPYVYYYKGVDLIENKTAAMSIKNPLKDHSLHCPHPQLLKILVRSAKEECKYLYCNQNNTGLDNCYILLTDHQQPADSCHWYIHNEGCENGWWFRIRKFSTKRIDARSTPGRITIQEYPLHTTFSNMRYPKEYFTIPSRSLHINATSESDLNIAILLSTGCKDLDPADTDDHVAMQCAKNTCYQFFRNYSISWKEANEDCLAREATLLSLWTNDELEFIKDTMATVWRDALHLNAALDVTFIGLTGTNAGKEGYRWTDGSPLTVTDWYYPFGDYNLLPSHPVLDIAIRTIQPTADVDQACVAMVVGNPYYSTNWRKIPCFEKFQQPSYICKFAKEERVPKREAKHRNISCLPYQLTCKDGTCLSPDSRCNKKVDCSEGEDEDNCSYGDNVFNCENGIKIHVSLCCDSRNDCIDNSDEESCQVDDCFRCSTGFCLADERLCDGIRHCPGGEDETNCPEGKRCVGFRCPSGNCIPMENKFDIFPDCVGDHQADEIYNFSLGKTNKHWTMGGNDDNDILSPSLCPGGDNESRCHAQHIHCYPRSKTCVYDRDSEGKLMYCTNGEHLRDCDDHSCPNMYKCPGMYCIPYRRVCDGFSDCPDQSDETDCDNYTSCPGLFRCSKERLCLSPNEVCDGVVHCKLSADDERFCEFNRNESLCPSNCLCEGYHVDCSRHKLDSIPFNVPENARSLLAHTNLMVHLADVLNYKYLVTFDVSNNQINDVDRRAFSSIPNLLHLRLQRNRIRRFESCTFANLHRLNTLEIQENPISYLPRGLFENQILLSKLNMSYLLLESLPTYIFLGLKGLQVLDLAGNRINVIEPQALDIFQHLDNMNLTKNGLQSLQPDSLETLKAGHLQTDSYRFCCYVSEHVDECSPEADITSSCSDLLASRYHKAAVWAIGISAFVGNAVVIIWRWHLGVNKLPSILVFNLCLSDFLMGLFLLIVASADVFYSGVYALHDPVWRVSFPCKIAGVVAMISCGMSMMMIVFIAVDRALKIVSSFGVIKNTVKRSVIIIAFGWLVTVILSVLPLLFPQYLVGFYGRTAICAPFIFSGLSGTTSYYAIAVFAVPSSLALLIVSISYVAIYLSVKESGKTCERQDKYEVELAKKFGLIILTDFLSWLPVMFTVIAFHFDLSLKPGETSVIALVILPLNSALNPYLYSFTRSKRTMERNSSDESGSSRRSTRRSN